MKVGDRADLVTAVGVCALVIALTDALFRYLRPGMRPYLIAAGVVLVLVGITGIVLGRRAQGDEEHHPASRVGWLLLLPIVVGLTFDPGALGAYAVGQGASLQFGEMDFDLAEHLRSHSAQGQVPDLQVLEFAWATYDRDSQRLLEDRPVRLTGFIVRLGEGSERDAFLARLQMGCCAGDAVPTTVRLAGVDTQLADETWVEVTGALDLEATHRLDDGSPVMHVTAIREVKEPQQPYEYYR